MYRKLATLLLLSFIFVLVFDYTEYQCRQSKPTETYSLLRDISFKSIDNEYYLSYTDNYLKGRGWRCSMYSMQNVEP